MATVAATSRLLRGEPPVQLNQPLNQRMKTYEEQTETRLQPSQPAILRLDGHSFSKFTAPFDKPFDERIHSAMVKTCGDLLASYPTATLAYTHSDEITLVFPHGVGTFNGRVLKISTLAAGFCSVHFHSNLMAALAETPSPAVNGLASLPLPHFDGRIFNMPTVEECLNNLMWRSRGDAVRNSISAFAQGHFSTAQLHGKSKEEMKEMVLREKGVVYEEAVPKWAQQGSIVKRHLVKMEAVNKNTGRPVVAVRTRMRCEDRGVMRFSKENLDLVKDKYWPDD